MNASSGAGSIANDGSMSAGSMSDVRLASGSQSGWPRAAGKRMLIDGLREIVANFLGSEELGLFRVDHQTTQRSRPTWSFGIDLQEYDLPTGFGQCRACSACCADECHVEVGDGGRADAK
jgi:hypothetical protein